MKPRYAITYLLFIIFVIVFYGLAAKGLFHKCPEPKLMSIIELQEAVGAKPDGIVGPDTIAKWDIAYANQEAARFMTPSGRPK